MLLSEIIKRLEEIKTEFGDRTCGIEVLDRCDTYTAKIVEVEAANGGSGLLSLYIVDEDSEVFSSDGQGEIDS